MNYYLKQFQSLKLPTIYIFLALMLHLISVYFSIGFYNDDEHFQILEPLAYLLGLNEILTNDPNGFYWEWQSDKRIRSWLQPYIYYCFVNFLKFFKIIDPFSWSFMIRLFTSLLGFLSIVYLFFRQKIIFLKRIIILIIYYFLLFGFILLYIVELRLKI